MLPRKPELTLDVISQPARFRSLEPYLALSAERWPQ